MRKTYTKGGVRKGEAPCITQAVYGTMSVTPDGPAEAITLRFKLSDGTETPTMILARESIPHFCESLVEIVETMDADRKAKGAPA